MALCEQQHICLSEDSGFRRNDELRVVGQALEPDQRHLNRNYPNFLRPGGARKSGGRRAVKDDQSLSALIYPILLRRRRRKSNQDLLPPVERFNYCHFRVPRICPKISSSVGVRTRVLRRVVLRRRVPK